MYIKGKGKDVLCMIKFKVGQQVNYNGETYTYVGWQSDYNVFANLNPRKPEGEEVLCWTDSEVEECIADGSLVV